MFLQVIGHHISSLILDDSEQKSYLWVLATFIKFEIASKKPPRDLGSIPGLGRSPGAGHGDSLQYSGLENPMDAHD